jgi:hypothetical protein
VNLQHFLARSIPEHDEPFFSSDQFPLDDEAIADTAINAMLLVMNNATRSIGNARTTIEDYAPLLAYGVRFPWRDRIALAAQIDTINDEVPRYASIGLTRHKRGAFAHAFTMSEIRHHDLPKRARTTLRGAASVFRVSSLTGFSGLSRTMTSDNSNDIETVVDGGFAGLMHDGIAIGSTESGHLSRWRANILSYIVSLHNDRRYFWEVTAVEPFMDRFDAKAMFSVDESYIKSLFYARSIPMTASGRLRPILHWVSAHKRRLERGVDIDVRKHLRGIDAFAMHGVNFCITEPRKQAAETTA